MKVTGKLCACLVVFLCSHMVTLAAGPGFSIEPAITPQGNPIFPIGWWYNVQRWYNTQTPVQEIDTSWGQMAAAGADTLYIAGGPNFNIYNHNLYLSYAAKHGLKLIFMIFRDDLTKIDDPLFGDSQKAAIIATIESDLQHPNFLGYSVGDELRDCDGPPSYATAAQQQWVMDRAKEWNANVMVLQSFGATQPLHNPGDGCSIEGRLAISDTLGFFRYPFAQCVPEYNPISITNNLLCINNLVRDAGGLVGARRGLFNIGQGVGTDWNLVPDPFAPCGMRYPLYGELRYDQWAGVAVNRQRGALYFEFGAPLESQSTGYVNFFNTILTPLMQEQRQLKHAMETGWDVGTVATNGDGYLWSNTTVRLVGSILVYDAEALKYYLILTNNRDTTNTVSVSISNLPTTLSSMTATLLNETGTGKDTVTMSNGQQGEYTFSVSMTKYDVDIYQISAGTAVFCAAGLQTDINDDCKVDFKDFAILASEWLSCNWNDQNLCN